MDQNTQEDAPNRICKLDRQTLDLIDTKNQMDLGQVDQDDDVRCSLSYSVIAMLFLKGLDTP